MGFLGFLLLGLIAGAIARAILPGKQKGGWFVTLLIGVVGALLGGWLGSLFRQEPKVPQGEYSFWLSDPTTAQYASTGFPSVTEAAGGVTTPPLEIIVSIINAAG